MSDQDQEKDPVVNSSLGKPLVISSMLLLLSLAWGLYDEVYGTRPWKSYQADFVRVYSKYLKSARPDEAKFEAQDQGVSEYKQLDKEMQDAEDAVKAEGKKIDDQVNQVIVPQTLALNEKFQEVRSEVTALTYQIEITTGENKKNSLREEIAKIKQRVVTVKLPTADGGTITKDYTYDQMDNDLKSWKGEKATLLQKRVDLYKPATELRAKRDKLLSDKIDEASTDTMVGVQKKLEDFPIKIRQIHVKDVDLVDRCESCHLGTREPLTLTKAEHGRKGSLHQPSRIKSC